MVCDRGLLDVAAYLPRKVWLQLLLATAHTANIDYPAQGDSNKSRLTTECKYTFRCGYGCCSRWGTARTDLLNAMRWCKTRAFSILTLRWCELVWSDSQNTPAQWVIPTLR